MNFYAIQRFLSKLKRENSREARARRAVEYLNSPELFNQLLNRLKELFKKR